MKNILIVLVLIVLFAFNGIAQQYKNECATGKQKYYERLLKVSKINYPGDSNIDVTYYKLNIKINHVVKQINGVVTVKAKSLLDGLTGFFLDLRNVFTVDSVKSGNAMLSFTHPGDRINITLSQPVNTGEEFAVDVYYRGRPGSSGFGSFEFGSHNGTPAIWSLSEPYGASDWWPCKDTPADKADSSDVWITADELFYSVSNGSLEAIVENGDGTRTFKWKNHHPIAHYLISVAMTNYEVYKNYFVYAPGDTMEVIHYMYPEDLATNKTNLDKTPEMLSIFSNLFGLYPYIDEKYGHAQFGWGGGMEHQTVSSMGSFGSGIVSHELAHQWFGDKITCKDWHHIWLNEGFATYCESLYKEMKYGYSSYKSSIASEMSYAKNAFGTIYVQNINSVSEIFDGSRSYAKGAVVLHMLRGVLGDSTFFDVLYSYINDPQLAYGVATTEDFQRVAEEVSGKDLEYFFKEWIYGEDFPVYNIDWGYSKIDNDSYRFRITIEQSNHKNPVFFTMPVQVKVTTTAGDTLLTFFNNQKSQTFYADVTGEPQSIKFDPENWILKTVQSITTSVKTGGDVPDKFALEQNYPNPFNPTTIIKYSIPYGTEVKVNLIVYDLLGKTVARLVNEKQSPGNYSVTFDASKLSSGLYFYRLTAGDFSQTRKMLLLK